jgi:hypothetical protein
MGKKRGLVQGRWEGYLENYNLQGRTAGKTDEYSSGVCAGCGEGRRLS